MSNKEILTKQVNSSNIKQVDYDPFMDTMTVGFSNNSVYEYYGVSIETYKELIEAKSVGKFFQKNIKNKFEFAKRGKLILEQSSQVENKV